MRRMAAFLHLCPRRRVNVLVHEPRRPPNNSSTAFLARRYYYRDPALVWAERNPEIAQKCLTCPSPSSSSFTNTTATTTNTTTQSNSYYHDMTSRVLVSSLEDYLSWRSWEFPCEHDDDLPYAHSLVSHVLTTPLTLWQHLPVFGENQMNKEKLTNHDVCIAILGARSEGSLPLEYWNEFLYLLSICSEVGDQQWGKKWRIDFIGPDCPVRPSSTLRGNGCELSLNWSFRGLFHHWDKDAYSQYDAFVLLNPGIGHPHLQKSWEPTLQLLFSQLHRHPILLTAHSELDAKRDEGLLHEKYCLQPSLQYQRNQFRSRIQYDDPFDVTHRVQPNHSFVLIRHENLAQNEIEKII